jgi:Ca-activated chloride channel homolog
MIQFGSPEFFWALLTLPFFGFLLILSGRGRRKILNRFIHPKNQKQLAPGTHPAHRFIRASLIMSILLMLVFALIRPQWGKSLEKIQRKGLDIMLVQDVSFSMLAEDVKPNRLTRAKHEISAFLAELHSDKVGLIAFAGEARILSPMTLDYSAARIFLDELNPNRIKPGTNLALALEKALSSIGPANQSYQVIVLLTDGEEHDPKVLEIAEKAAEKNIRVYTIGIGSLEGVPIPVGKGNYKKDKKGNLITTHLEENTLKEISRITSARYFHASPGKFRLTQILEDIKDMERREIEEESVEQYTERFQLPLALAILLLILESLMAKRFTRNQRKDS